MILKLQSYFFITGLWSVLHMPPSFDSDWPKNGSCWCEWVGLLSASIGITLFPKTIDHPYTLEVLAALSYLAIDCLYVFKNVISLDYLLSKATIQIGVLIWFFVSFKSRNQFKYLRKSRIPYSLSL